MQRDQKMSRIRCTIDALLRKSVSHVLHTSVSRGKKGGWGSESQPIKKRHLLGSRRGLWKDSRVQR